MNLKNLIYNSHHTIQIYISIRILKYSKLKVFEYLNIHTFDFRILLIFEILKYSNSIRILGYSNYIRQIIEQLKYSNIRIPKNSTNSPSPTAERVGSFQNTGYRIILRSPWLLWYDVYQRIEVIGWKKKHGNKILREMVVGYLFGIELTWSKYKTKASQRTNGNNGPW